MSKVTNKIKIIITDFDFKKDKALIYSFISVAVYDFRLKDRNS